MAAPSPSAIRSARRACASTLTLARELQRERPALRHRLRLHRRRAGHRDDARKSGGCARVKEEAIAMTDDQSGVSADQSAGSRAALVNRRTVRIEWADCDPAGIVFYPRYFEMFDAATNYLFEARRLEEARPHRANSTSSAIRWSTRAPSSSLPSTLRRRHRHRDARRRLPQLQLRHRAQRVQAGRERRTGWRSKPGRRGCGSAATPMTPGGSSRGRSRASWSRGFPASRRRRMAARRAQIRPARGEAQTRRRRARRSISRR